MRLFCVCRAADLAPVVPDAVQLFSGETSGKNKPTVRPCLHLGVLYLLRRLVTSQDDKVLRPLRDQFMENPQALTDPGSDYADNSAQRS